MVVFFLFEYGYIMLWILMMGWYLSKLVWLLVIVMIVMVCVEKVVLLLFFGVLLLVLVLLVVKVENVL